jgi:peptide chain release factor 1
MFEYRFLQGAIRNKHENACRAIHMPTGIVKTAQMRSRKASKGLAMEALREEVGRRASLASAAGTNAARRGQIGSGERSDKRRTWRFQEDRVVDHATGRSARASAVLKGRFEGLWA